MRLLRDHFVACIFLGTTCCPNANINMFSRAASQFEMLSYKLYNRINDVVLVTLSAYCGLVVTIQL